MTLGEAVGGFQVAAIGVVVAVEFDESTPADTVAAVHESWAGALTDQTPADAVVQMGTGPIDNARERLSVDVTLAALQHRSGELIMFHAAGVADPDGNVAAFVGPSGRGKTTLSRALGPHFGYVSDETIAIDAHRRIYPYRKPLSLVRAGRPKEQVAPRAAGLSDLPAAELRLSALVLLERVDDPVDPRWEPVGVIDALTDLVPQMSYLAEIDRPLQRVCALMDAVGGVQRLVYSEATATVPVVAQILAEGRPVASAQWSPATTDPLPAHVVDAIVVGSSLVVLADRTVHVLDGIAPEIWVRTVAGATRDEVVAAVVARYGAPPSGDAAELVEDALAALVAAAVLDAPGGASR